MAVKEYSAFPKAPVLLQPYHQIVLCHIKDSRWWGWSYSRYILLPQLTGHYTELNVMTVLFQIIKFSINTQFSSIWPIDRTLSVATTLSQSGPGSDGNEGVLGIPKSSHITGTSPSDCLVSCPGHSFSESYSPADKQSVYFYSPSRQGNKNILNSIYIYIYIYMCVCACVCLFVCVFALGDILICVY